MKVCPKCSSTFEDNLNFCRHDGARLYTAGAGGICPQCGKRTEEGKKFCRYCGADLGPRKKPEEGDRISVSREPLACEEEKTQLSIELAGSPAGVAEKYLAQGNYKDAIDTLELFVKNNPEDSDARLVHLLASVKLYNIYGYEKQIESIRTLSNLNERQRGIASQIFSVRSEEARKRGREDEAREYEYLAKRVALGQLSVESMQQAKSDVAPFSENKAGGPAREAAIGYDDAETPAERLIEGKRKIGGVWIGFILVLGLGGILTGWMLGLYPEKWWRSEKELAEEKTQNKQRLEPGKGGAGSSASARVIGVKELGFKVWAEGTPDANRQESSIGERIESQLASLRQLYQQVIQQKPDLMGSITLQLTVSPSGTVTKVQQLASRIKDKAFEKSVIDESYKWHFPKASSGLVKINYPLLFVPPGMDMATLIKWEQVVGLAGQESGQPKRVGSVAGERGASLAGGGASAGPEPSKEPVTFSPGQSAPVVVKVILGTYEVRYATSVYSEPRENSQRLARIEAGTRVNVVDIQGEWLEIRSRHGRPPGFVKKESAVPLGNQ